MPYGGPTPATRVAGRTLCFVSYGLTLVVAVGDYFWPSVTIAAVSEAWTNSVAAGIAILSLWGMVALLGHRWRAEWVPCTTLFFLLLARAAPVWTNLDENITRLSAAAMMTLGALCLGKRALDLWRFDVETRRAAKNAQEPARDA